MVHRLHLALIEEYYSVENKVAGEGGSDERD